MDLQACARHDHELPRQQPGVLWVDDGTGLRSSLRSVLGSSYCLHTASGGAAALDILGREAIDLVVSDLGETDPEGANFRAQVRERWPQVMHVLSTSDADIDFAVAAFGRGEVDRYVRKPTNDHELLLLVHDVMERSRLKAENRRLRALTRAQNERIQDLNAHLEQRVRDRTDEVEQVNSLLKQANAQLRKNFLVSIKMFSSLVEMRGGAIAGHSRRVADLSRKLAIKLGLSDKDQQNVFLAGLLHDIGKIAFSDALLGQSVSTMTPEEWTQYRQHCVSGELALMPLEELKEVAALVRSHHERFDGRGWPDGLSGQDIPLGARILMVVNGYDGCEYGALTDNCVDRELATVRLIQGRGSRYDPEVVDAFLAMVNGRQPTRQREIELPPSQLKPGMVLAQDFVSGSGALLLSADKVLDVSIIKRITDYAEFTGRIPGLYIRDE